MQPRSRRLLLPVFALLLILSSLTGLRGEDGFVPLFNGRDLSGWVNVNCAPSTWTFNEEGLLVCSGIPTGEIRTERMYQNFILELEWRHLVPKGNAGVFVWADDITARGTPFIRSIEIQVLENAYGNTENYSTHGDIFPIQGATMTPMNGRGGMRSFPTELLSKPSPEWNHYRIECRDGTVVLRVNGTKVNEGRDSIPRKGYLCLESEGGIVHYRNVRIKELPDSPVKPEHIAIANRDFRSLYSGVDLSGWEAGGGWAARDWILAHTASGEGTNLLTTLESFRSVAFVFDFCFKEDSGALRFFPRGREHAAIPFAPGDAALEQPGKWNRVEGEIRDDRLTWQLNGAAKQEVETHPSEGPFGFAADGNLEMSNFYIRPISPEN